MKITVVGAGYVGLVAGAGFSSTGNEVSIVDIDPSRIKTLLKGRSPIYEPGLEELLEHNLRQGRLSFTTDLGSAVEQAEVVILAVGTPSAPDGSVDMGAMEAAARDAAPALRGYTVVVTKSTVPVGTHKRLSEIIASLTDAEFDYVANPEFLKEGNAVGDFLKPDRVIVGVTGERALKIMRHLYAPFMMRSDRMLVMDPASAEMTKYACNVMLATRVSFMNELSQLCQRLGADIELVRRGMSSDHRIGSDFLFPSLGYGGSCLPKDVKALISMGRGANHPMRIAEAVDMANEAQREAIFRRVELYFRGSLQDKRIAVWGLAFKARTDDVRESSALVVIRRLLGAGASVAAHDPQALKRARAVLGGKHVEYVKNMYDALAGADALVICTEWSEYRTPDFGRMKSLLNQPVIFDGRNLYDLEWMRETGVTYFSIGRPVVSLVAGGEGVDVKALVTGAAGFIGSHAVDRLLADGEEVVGVDNFDPFYEREIKEANLLGARSYGGFAFAEADICDVGAMGRVFDRHGPFDVVVHLAAKAGVRPSIADPRGCASANVAGTVNLLELSVQPSRKPRFVFGSSSSVYGNNPKVPFSETDPVDHPISPYAATKKACELICHAYHHLYGLRVYCLRFFTVYGPRQRPDLAIHKFARKILAGEPIPMFGDGSSSRDYTYIDDILQGLRCAIDRCEGYEIINLGSSSPIALREMIRVVAEACGEPPVVRQLPVQPGDVDRTFADVEKAARLLDYRPAVPFEEGVRRFVEWLRATGG